jgi:ribosomal protein L16/L10AE
VTSKPTASRMGKGKGNVKYYVTLTAKSQPLLQFQSTKYRNQNQLKAVMLKKLNAIISLPVSIRNTKSRWN